jgi:glycosyltransferase involved in cell wall biosynthesis
VIVGEGPERRKLELLIRELKIAGIVELVGHVPRADIGGYYELADLVVLTSRSEGIPLALMEAMARSKLVLAPAISGIPELVIDGKTGFLYKPGSMEDFVRQVEKICSSLEILQTIRQSAREHVKVHFEQSRNLGMSANLLLQKVASHARSCDDENLILQQI